MDYSICTLEFESRRESYFWVLEALDLYRPKVRMREEGWCGVLWCGVVWCGVVWRRGEVRGGEGTGEEKRGVEERG